MTTTAEAKPDRVKELEQQLRAANKELEKARAENERLSPTIDIRHFLFKSTDDVKEYFAEQKLRDLAQAELVDENRVRQRTGLDPIRYTEDEWAAAVDRVAQELLDERSLNGAPVEGPLNRTLKMWDPRTNTLRQIPYEGQINNVAGSLADGLVVYQRKGFKRVEPMLCPAGECHEEAARVETGKHEGKWAFEGYCSEDHYLRTERGAEQRVPGITSRDSLVGA